MLLASVFMLPRLHKGRMNFFGVLTYAFTWIIMVASLVVTTLAIIDSTGIMNVTKLVKSLGDGINQFASLTFGSLMMKIAIYALTVLTIAQLIIHPLVWTTKKEYATPVAQADGNGYIVVDEDIESFDETSKKDALDVDSVEVDPTEETVEEPVVEEPVAEEPIVEEPIVEEPVTEEPIVEEPIEELVTDEPIVEEPIEEPVTEEPIIEETTEEPVVQEPIVEEPIAEETAVEEPIVEEPIEEPVAEEPIVEEPAVDEPKIEVKTIARPSRTGSRIVARNSGRRSNRVSDSASAMFAEYLKEKTAEEKEQIEKSIDRVVVGKNGKK